MDSYSDCSAGARAQVTGGACQDSNTALGFIGRPYIYRDKVTGQYTPTRQSHKQIEVEEHFGTQGAASLRWTAGLGNTAFFRRCAVPRVPDSFHAPIDQGSPPGQPQNVGPSSSSLGAVSPGSPPPPPGPLSLEGASAIHTPSGRLCTAPRHLLPSDALCTCRGASRRRPTSVAASGSSLSAARARRAPTAGVRPGGASTARPTRSAGSDPCG